MGDDWVEQAKAAITAVFSDRSVSRSETKARLMELLGDIDIMLDTLNDA